MLTQAPIKIELRGIKVLASMSEETHCYEATLIVDGQIAGRVGNAGHGGGDDIGLKPGFKLDAINARIAATFPPIEFGDSDPLTPDLETVCCDLVNAFLCEKHVKRATGRSILVATGGKVFQWAKKQKGRDAEAAIRAHVAAKYPEGKIINDLALAEAIEVMRKAGAL